MNTDTLFFMIILIVVVTRVVLYPTIKKYNDRAEDFKKYLEDKDE